MDSSSTSAASSASLPSISIRTRIARPAKEHARQVWATHNKVPNWKQEAVQKAVVSIYGAGGIGSQLAWSALKYGVGDLHISDPDFVEVSNLNRQFLLLEDVGQAKAHALPRRLAPHGIMGSVIHGHPMYCEEFFSRFPLLTPTVGICGVDNDVARVAAVQHHLQIRVPLICVCLNIDAGGGLVLVQQPDQACVGCYLGSVLGKRKGACPGAPAIIDCCQTVCGFAAYAMRQLLVGGPLAWNVATVALQSGATTHMVSRRPDCSFCSKF